MLECVIGWYPVENTPTVDMNCPTHAEKLPPFLESGPKRELEMGLVGCQAWPVMEAAQNAIEIYQVRVVFRETSPHIWRRFLVRSDSSIVDLHQTIPIALGWSGRCAFQLEV